MDNEILSLAEQQARICRIFSNTKRLLILITLNTEEKSVNEISSLIGESLQNTSQHLRLMRISNILETRREGQTIYYRIADNNNVKCLSNLLEISY
jgi:DNA-binding transcriptional ArsR family regulator